MDKQRYLELLAYASVCFDRCTNPFETVHLLKKNVKASECIDLSHQIANTLELEAYLLSPDEAEKAIEKAKQDFEETQKEL